MQLCQSWSAYWKPGNAFVFLLCCWYHSRHAFRGWLKAEMHRLLTHSSNTNIWLEECHKFYYHMLARGYLACFIDATFSKVSWNQLSKLLEPKVTSKANNFFTLEGRSMRSCSSSIPGAFVLEKKHPLYSKGAGRGWWLQYLSSVSLLYSEER